MGALVRADRGRRPACAPTTRSATPSLFARGCVSAPLDRLALFSRWFTLLFVLDDAQDTAVFEQRDEQFLRVQDDLVALLRGGPQPTTGGSGLLPAVAEPGRPHPPPGLTRLVGPLRHPPRAHVLRAARREPATPRGRALVARGVQGGASRGQHDRRLLRPGRGVRGRRGAQRVPLLLRVPAAGRRAQRLHHHDERRLRRRPRHRQRRPQQLRHRDPAGPRARPRRGRGAGDRRRRGARGRACRGCWQRRGPSRPRLTGPASADAVERACRGWWGFSLNVPRFYLAVGSRLEHMNAFPDGVAPSFTPDLLPRS
nr:hypothetical protein [Angustibacter aerolatus]